MEERNTNFYTNDGLIMQGEQIDTSVAVKNCIRSWMELYQRRAYFYGNLGIPC